MSGKRLLAGVSLVSLALFGCGGGGGGGETISGVWEGSYTDQSGPTSGSPAEGPICLEINQNGAQVTGKAWVSGYIWGGSYSGTASGTTFTGQVSGNDLNDQSVTVNFDGNISGDKISGTVTIGSKTYNINLDKKSKSNCGWASRELALAFGRALGGAISGNPSSPDPTGNILASFITVVPRVDVKVDTQTYQNWWACIWEIRDTTGGTPSEYTVAGIVDTTTFSRFAGWYVSNATPSIGLKDSSSNYQAQQVDATLGNSGDVALYTDGTLTFFSDGTSDTYFNNGTQLQAGSNPFYVSPCDPDTGTQYKVWMTNISSFYIKFDGPGTDFQNHSFESPPGASNTPPSTNDEIPALYIEKVSCTP
ncbi:hypothetical protein BCF55_1694 [Hydrogenivirga caldilitoris]|uniref:Uncharacterized protein n=1 Tax=Hydrogenivirga caldilitoris TaxID=246264 RepID=A0A497XW56_9AQUI|nr:hypothetical protein [Hydrogenivirga caldilitoris]RLJ71392.1 hypothetical protein BCF55_1694 [Hydrogenivirga caldilitoris]